MDDAALKAEIAALLASVGIAHDRFEVEACRAGGNNRVYRVVAGTCRLVGKRYFRDSSDGRDRLSAEYAFLNYAKEAGIGCVPRPVAKNDTSGIALYEFIDGRELSQRELVREHVERAQEFFVNLNSAPKRILGANLPMASEACFSIAGQLDLVQARVDRLCLIRAKSDTDAQAIAFVAELRERWASLRENVVVESKSKGFDPTIPLDPEDRCISPSDFGFHNAVVTRSGSVFFFDFEYAGWDDPAKAVSDFFSHPGVPVSYAYFESFLHSAMAYSPNAGMLAERTRLMLPVFRVKWCCIVLNDFLPAVFVRRKFADPSLDELTQKRVQLKKARRLLQLIG